VGLFGIVWEWLYARKRGVPITRAGKVYLAMALPLVLAGQLVLESDRNTSNSYGWDRLGYRAQCMGA
jgi:hypothetical protein